MTADIREFILPAHMREPQAIQPLDAPEAGASDEQRAKSVPKPTGWRVLCMVPKVDEKFANSSLVKADSFMKQEEHATAVLFVVELGPDAYADKAKFPSGAWCKEGDFVLVRTYAGTRFKVYGQEFRLLNDDQIDGVVEDPRGVTRAY